MKEYQIRLKEKVEENYAWMEKEEQEVLKSLIEYVDFVHSYFYEYKAENEYDHFRKWILQKHLDILEEALENICLGNLCSSACLIRIIIENYVLFYFIKKYKKQEIWKDYRNWSFVHSIKMFPEETRRKKLRSLVEEYATKENWNIEDYEGKGSYIWLSRVIKLKDYTFKKVSELVDTEEDIYKDFNVLSRFIHNNDYITKMEFYDSLKMAYLTSFLLKYTDGILSLFDKRSLRGAYRFYFWDLQEALEKCNNNYQQKLTDII